MDALISKSSQVGLPNGSVPPGSLKERAKLLGSRTAAYVRAKSRIIFAGAFFVLMISIASACIFLFYRALVHYPHAVELTEDGIKALPMADRWLLIGIVGLITLVPVVLLYRQLLRVLKSDDFGESLLHLSVHAVPYGILSLSMLFEYHKLVEGHAEGAAALASIMILFILSELGLILFSEVREAKGVSRELSETLLNVGNTHESLKNELQGLHVSVGALPWVSYNAQITALSSGDAPLVPSLTKLLEMHLTLLQTSEKNPSRIGQLLRNVLMAKYVQEEFKDLIGDLKGDQIPEGLTLPGSIYLDRASFFATNIGFYAEYLKTAVTSLSKEIGGERNPKRAPCIVAVTNSLPSQFWNWPIDDSVSREYGPISEYRQAQFDAVARGYTRIFRLMLVSDQPAEAGVSEKWKRSKDIPVLWSKDEWQEQRSWKFIFNKNDNAADEPLSRKNLEQFPFSDENLVCQSLAWARGRSSDNAYWMVRREPDNSSDPKHMFRYESVWSYYCKKMHVPNSAGGDKIGCSEIFEVPRHIFTDPWDEGGLAKCSDLMFLGTCSSTEPDVWSDNSVDWGVALMTSMSSKTETMFLLLVHDAALINELWKGVGTVRSKLGRALESSSDTLKKA